RLGIQVEQVLLDNPTALQKIKSGEVAALVRVIGKPVEFFNKIPANSGLHLVPIPFSKTFADYYTVGELSKEDYPTLVNEGDHVARRGGPAVLGVFNWQKGTERYNRTRHFVESLFANWDKFRHPPRHPKWRDVNLAATVPGWQRWSVAEEMLQKMQQEAGGAVAAATNATGTNGDFGSSLAARGVTNLTAQQRDALFQEFEQWQQRRHAQPQPR